MVLLVIACLMFIIFGYFAYIEGKEVQINNFEEVGKHYTNFASRSFASVVESGKGISELVSKTALTEEYLEDPYDTGLWFRIRSFLSDASDKIPGLKTIQIIPKNLSHLSLVYPLGTDKEEVKVSDDFFEDNSIYISPIIHFLGIQEFYIITPVYRGEDIEGYIYVTISLEEYMSEVIKNTRFKETGFMFLVNGEGKIIYQPDIKNYEVNHQVPTEDLDRIGYAVKLEEQERYIYIEMLEFSKASKEKVYFIYTQDEAELFEFNVELRNTTIMMILTFVILFGLLTVLYGRRYSRLINEDTKLVVEETVDHEIEKQTRILKRIAETDSLTKLYNHGSIYKIIEKEIEMSEVTKDPLTLMMLDLDYFKEVNDTYGHPVGDEVLVKVSELLKENIRDIDVAGRYGGEEFTILLKNIHLDKGYVIAERIRKTILSTDFTSEKIKLSISIGIAEWSGDDVASFIKKADKKLYASKAYGRNKTTF
jgi:diguanylate cyclase (GGDEF)-like protein